MKLKSIENNTENFQTLVNNLNQKNAVKTAIIIVLSIICLALVLLDGYLGSRAKRVPYVIELSSDGNATYYKNAVKLLEDYTPSTITQKYFITAYLTALRTVSTDNFVNSDNVEDVCNKTTDKAISQIQEFYTKNNPISLSDSKYIVVPTNEISCVQYSNTKWKLSWRETSYRKYDKAIISDIQYEGIFDVAFYTPETEQQLERNPIGMYVTNFDIDIVRSLI